jgi:hypothetical protein
MLDETKKICNNCKREKKLEEFHKDKTKKFGVKNICKDCRNNKKKMNKNFISINKSIAASIYNSIKFNYKFSWEEIVGYSINELKSHIEKQFNKDMSWENYGKTWCIKKIIKDKFYTSAREIINSWSLKNLIPLYKKENIEFNLDIIEKRNLYDILPIGWVNKGK